MQSKNKIHLNTEEIIRHFNGIAENYDRLSFLEQHMGERLLEHLEFIKLSPKIILDLGGSRGFFSEKLAALYPNAFIINLDAAFNMLHFRASASQVHASVHGICSNIKGKLPFTNNTFDFIFSNALFPWCQDIPTLFNEIQRVLKPDGLFLFSSLGPDTFIELQDIFKMLKRDSPLHSLLDMHFLGDALMQAQLKDPVMDMELCTIPYSNFNELRAYIKELGFSYFFSEELNFEEIATTMEYEISKQYESYQEVSTEIPATFEIVYGQAFAGKEENKKQKIRIPVSIRES